MFSKSSMKEDDIKSLIYAVKKEFQQEINALNDRISNLERKNQHLEEYNNNLNTFIQHHFERLDRKTDENHTYILNMWNPFMQSTIEKVKDDLIKSINDNKKDDIELSKKVDKLTVQVSDLNKMVIDEGFVDIVFKYGVHGSLNFIPIKKNIEVFDLFDKDIFFYGAFFNGRLGSGGIHSVYLNPIHLNLFPNLKKINLTKMLNTYFSINAYCSETYIQSVNFMLNDIVDKDYIYDLIIDNCNYHTKDWRCPLYIQGFNDAKILRNKQIDILKKYIETNFPHIEII